MTFLPSPLLKGLSKPSFFFYGIFHFLKIDKLKHHKRPKTPTQPRTQYKKQAEETILDFFG